MLSNYLKIAIRNLLKHKVYSLINVLGLAIGMSCCLPILLYVKGELGYDSHHEHAAQIYRATLEAELPGRHMETATAVTALAPTLRREVPEVVAATRLLPLPQLVDIGETQFYEERFMWADPEFFAVFTFPLAMGDASTALSAPNTAVLSRQAARKYFGDEDPLGQTIRLADGPEYQVTGVLEDIPDNVHFHFDILAALSTIKPEEQGHPWANASFYTYLRLQQGTAPEFIEKRIGELLEANAGEFLRSIGAEFRFHLQALTDIHLYSQRFGELEPNGNIAYVYAFSAIAVFILLIACINFTNLATARSAGRAREVGVRKVVGAVRGQLARQFLSESLIMCLLALAAALALIEVLLPFFSDLAGKNLSFNYAEEPFILLSMLGLVVAVGMLAGVYPAFFLSSFQAVKVLKGSGLTKVGGRRFRSALVVAQFAISIGLIVGTLVIDRQMQYLRSKNLGFDKENLVTMPVRIAGLRSELEALKNELLSHPDIIGVTASSVLPGMAGEKIIFWEKGRPIEESMVVAQMRVDRDYLETMKIELKSGAAVLREGDQGMTFLVNEAAARLLGGESIIGREIGQQDSEKSHFGEIGGVVGDFHFESLRAPIDPAVIRLGFDSYYNYITVRLRPGDPAVALGFMESQWKAFSGSAFEYTFLDERLQQLYGAEQRLGQVFQVFAALAIFVACLGLFGLASFTAEQRTKEIGVRKVLGASMANIVLLLSKEFTWPVIVANAIAWPVAYWGMERWLRNFTYHIDIEIGSFVLGGALALVTAWLMVGHRAIRAALANPVEALRYE